MANAAFNATYRVKASWDAEAKAWMLTSREIPGLVLSAKSAEEVERKLRVSVFPLLESHKLPFEGNIAIYVDYEGEQALSLNKNAA